MDTLRDILGAAEMVKDLGARFELTIFSDWSGSVKIEQQSGFPKIDESFYGIDGVADAFVRVYDRITNHKNLVQRIKSKLGFKS